MQVKGKLKVVRIVSGVRDITKRKEGLSAP
jgi:hypothetical protein